MCSAVLAHIFLKEQLNIFGILGCILCITGSITIVLHVPAEQPIESVAQVWQLAMQPGKQQAAARGWQLPLAAPSVHIGGLCPLRRHHQLSHRHHWACAGHLLGAA